MTRDRRRRGFEPVGIVRPEQLGISARRARELALAHAWSTVAGPKLADRAPALRIERGVLVVRAPDERWAGTLTELIPQLAGRLAAAFPELGVRRFRIEREGESGVRPSRSVPAVDPRDEPRRAEREDPPSAQPERPVSERLESLMQRYLDRRGQKPDQKP